MLHVHIRPDKWLKEKFRKIEETPEAHKARKVKEGKMGNLKVWGSLTIETATDFTPQEKIARDKLDSTLTDKAQSQQTKCWMDGCQRMPNVWIREIQYDMKQTDKAGINHASVSSSDYAGPVPGFCIGHLTTGPQELAEAVYFSRGEVVWGLRPERWFVIFTDGTKQGGECLQIDPKQISPTIIES